MAKLPDHLHDAYEWTDAADELIELASLRGEALDTYVGESVASHSDAGGDPQWGESSVDESGLRELAEWLRAHEVTVVEQIEFHLDRLTARHGPVHSLTVTDDDDELPPCAVAIRDDHATAICIADRLLELLAALPDDAPLGVEDAEPGSVWATIIVSEDERAEGGAGPRRSE